MIMLVLLLFLTLGLIILFKGERIILWWYKVGIYVSQKLGILPEPPELIMSKWLDTPFHKAAMVLFRVFWILWLTLCVTTIIIVLYGMISGE